MKHRLAPTLALFALLHVPILAQDSARRELAEIRVALSADRAYPEARERLEALRKELEARGDEPEAQALLDEVDRLLGEVRRALGVAAADAPAQESQDKVDTEVRRALGNGNSAFITNLGKRAIPALAEDVRTAHDELPTLEWDALYHLARIDPLAASQLVGELIDQEGFFWKKRVIRTIDETDLPMRPELWSVNAPKRFLGDGLLQFLEKSVGDPDIGNAVLARVENLLPDNLTRVLRDALVTALHSEDQVRRGTAKEVVRGQESMRPIFEELLSGGDADLRIFAAAQLMNSADADVLLRHMEDPEPKVRYFVANWLANQHLERGPREREALARLALDPDPATQGSALHALETFTTVERAIQVPAEDLVDPRANARRSRIVFREPLEAETYRALARSGDPNVRKWVVSIAERLPAALAFEVLRALAGDLDPEVAEDVRRPLGAVWWEDAAATLGVASVLLENPVLRRARTLEGLTSLFPALSWTNSGMVALIRWLVAQRADDIQAVLSNLDANVVDGPRPVIRVVPPELLRDYTTRLFQVLPHKVGFLLDSQDLTRPQLRALGQLASDPEQHVVLRLFGAGAILKIDAADEAWMRNAHALLADPFWRRDPGESWGFVADVVKDVLQRVPGAQRNELLLDAVRDPTLSLAIFGKAIEIFDYEAPGAAEITSAILQRWFEAPELSSVSMKRAVERAFFAMGRNPAVAQREALERAAREPQHGFARSAFQAIGALRDPSYLPLIREILEAPSASAAQTFAAEALTEFLTEDAAELLLLAAARTQNGELRDRCLAHLEKIREYQDAKQRWAARKAEDATRAEAVAELVALLDAKDTAKRVQAIRALATWEAVEAMPRLIRLLSDPSKEVAAAAREALDRLNRREGD
jgi:DNA polymerase III delta prime subunit